MIDSTDTTTADLFQEPKKKRGRPATGKALSPAERKRRQRRRHVERVRDLMREDVSVSELPMATLTEMLPRLVQWGQSDLVERICAELIVRTETNRKLRDSK